MCPARTTLCVTSGPSSSNSAEWSQPDTFSGSSRSPCSHRSSLCGRTSVRHSFRPRSPRSSSLEPFYNNTLNIWAGQMTAGAAVSRPDWITTLQATEHRRDPPDVGMCGVLHRPRRPMFNPSRRHGEQIGAFALYLASDPVPPPDDRQQFLLAADPRTLRMGTRRCRGSAHHARSAAASHRSPFLALTGIPGRQHHPCRLHCSAPAVLWWSLFDPAHGTYHSRTVSGPMATDTSDIVLEHVHEDVRGRTPCA